VSLPLGVGFCLVILDWPVLPVHKLRAFFSFWHGDDLAAVLVAAAVVCFVEKTKEIGTARPVSLRCGDGHRLESLAEVTIALLLS